MAARGQKGRGAERVTEGVAMVAERRQESRGEQSLLGCGVWVSALLLIPKIPALVPRREGGAR